MCTVNLPALLNNPSGRKKNLFSKTWDDPSDKSGSGRNRYPVYANSEFVDYLRSIKLKTHSQAPTKSPVKLKETSQTVNIPQSFYDPDFSLNNESTFHKIIPLHYRNPRDRKSLQFHDRLPLHHPPSLLKLNGEKLSLKFNSYHENLSHMLDSIELQIAQQVSSKSSSFFDAILCHDVAYEKIDKVVLEVRTLRNLLKNVESNCVHGAARIFAISRRSQNLNLVLSLLNLLTTTSSAQPTLQALLKQRDYLSALDVLHTTLFLLSHDDRKHKHTKNGPFTKGLHCVRHLAAQLKEYRPLISLISQNDFLSCLNRILSPDDFDSTPDILQFVMINVFPSLLAFLKLERFDFPRLVRETGSQKLAEVVQQHICDAFKHSIADGISNSSHPRNNDSLVHLR
ncbi:Vacuolar protein sorting-associated protein 54 [Cichlidogyrus casuarinus]|uniref:Vacuolar protein sorting-associated protein 54 n=1 Tax=Cichlidogyrus casuarinus TaxID=1844966 RepID=A0ABD2Q3M7_9PLAT